jgi:predicted RNA-binding protein YlxR (DUF448 family)
MRMCVVTRQSLPEDRLVRFALSPDGDVVPDLQRKLPGRGVWVSLSRAQVAEAVKKQVFRRGFETECRAADELAGRIGQQLRAQALSHLMLARKAGEAVAGMAKVEQALTRGPVLALLHAKEAAADGCRKLNRLALPDTQISDAFHGPEMDLAFGRSNVIHAAVAAGGLGERLVYHIRRLEEYDATQQAQGIRPAEPEESL